VRIWDRDSGKPIATLHSTELQCVKISPDKRTLACCGYGKTIQLFDMDLQHNPLDASLQQDIRAKIARFHDDDIRVREAIGRQLAQIGFVAFPELQRAERIVLEIHVEQLNRLAITA